MSPAWRGQHEWINVKSFRGCFGRFAPRTAHLNIEQI